MSGAANTAAYAHLFDSTHGIGEPVRWQDKYPARVHAVRFTDSKVYYDLILGSNASGLVGQRLLRDIDSCDVQAM